MQDVLLRRVGKAHPVEYDVLTGGGDGFALGAFRRGLRDLCDLFHIAEDARHTADIHEKLHLVCLCRRVGLVDRDAAALAEGLGHPALLCLIGNGLTQLLRRIAQLVHIRLRGHFLLGGADVLRHLRLVVVVFAAGDHFVRQIAGDRLAAPHPKIGKHLAAQIRKGTLFL